MHDGAVRLRAARWGEPVGAPRHPSAAAGPFHGAGGRAVRRGTRVLGTACTRAQPRPEARRGRKPRGPAGLEPPLTAFSTIRTRFM